MAVPQTSAMTFTHFISLHELPHIKTPLVSIAIVDKTRAASIKGKLWPRSMLPFLRPSRPTVRRYKSLSQHTLTQRCSIPNLVRKEHSDPTSTLAKSTTPRLHLPSPQHSTIQQPRRRPVPHPPHLAPSSKPCLLIRPSHQPCRYLIILHLVTQCSSHLAGTDRR